ncbi:MAG: serine hydrolase domain-containing protein [Rectinemataceae bacterium]|jgi:CubicO group peptidase (beta-lactamase class C family)
MKALKRIAPFFVIAAAALLLLYLPDIAPERYTDLATFVRVEMLRQGYSGLSVAAVADGSVLYVDGFGKDGSGAAIGPDTRLYAPAAAKSMAALAAYSLVRGGWMSLDQRVRDYLPWFGFADAKGDVSIRNLISHTSGLSDSAFDDLHPYAPDLASAVRSMVGAVPTSAPGSSFHYLDTDYQALALVMEKVTGKPYSTILDERVFRPLGMRSSSAQGIPPLPRGTASFFALALPRAAPHSAFGAPSGYVVTTASDMGQYMAFLLGPEKFKRGPVSARAVGTLFNPLVPKVPYGYGLFLGQGDGGRLAYHDGSLDGFSSRIVLWPEKRMGIALLAAQGSLLQSLISLPALTEGARRIVLEGGAPRPFPLGRLYILLAVVAFMHIFALALQTGGALRWAKEVRDKSDAKGSKGPFFFALFRCWTGIAMRAAIAVFCPLAIGFAFGRVVSWSTLFELEPGLAAWCLFACMFGFLRNAARLAWIRGPVGFRRPR